MANISSRVLALGTVAGVAAAGLASASFASFYPTKPANMVCTGYGFVSGYGYGYDCVTPTSGTTGTTGAGGGTSVTGNANINPTTPTVTLFPNFVSACGKEATTLSDSNVTAYYDKLNILNRVNATSRNLTRAEFLKLTLNAAGIDVTNEAAPQYSDVSADHSLAKYITYATRTGIVSGMDNKFRPNDSISRGEAMKILVNSTKVARATTSTSFADVPMSYSLAIFVQTAKDNCIVQGVNPTRFEPLRGITVAETAKVLYNMSQAK